MSATAPPEHPAAPPGRRERKKQRTRDAIITTSLTLFLEKGVEGTTVEEIADAVDVSSRTFFRYFSSKEDVVLSQERDKFDAILAAIAERPLDEPAVTAIRHGAVSVMRALEDDVDGLDSQRFLRVQELIYADQMLLTRSIENSTARLDDLASLIADRMGVDPQTDMRPHLVAGITFCGVRSALDSWGRRGNNSKASEAIDQALTWLEGGVNYRAIG